MSIEPAGDCTAEEARELVDSIRADLGDLAVRVSRAYTGRAWLALGYADWPVLCAAEFGGVPRLPAGERRPVVRELTQAGMSTRAIGTALGVSHETVAADRAVRNLTPDRPTVVGLDGKRYTPPAPRAEPPPIPPRPTVDPQYRAQQVLDALYRFAELAASDLAVVSVVTRETLRSELRAALYLLTEGHDE